MQAISCQSFCRHGSSHWWSAGLTIKALLQKSTHKPLQFLSLIYYILSNPIFAHCTFYRIKCKTHLELTCSWRRYHTLGCSHHRSRWPGTSCSIWAPQDLVYQSFCSFSLENWWSILRLPVFSDAFESRLGHIRTLQIEPSSPGRCDPKSSYGWCYSLGDPRK